MSKSNFPRNRSTAVVSNPVVLSRNGKGGSAFLGVLLKRPLRSSPGKRRGRRDFHRGRGGDYFLQLFQPDKIDIREVAGRHDRLGLITKTP